MKEGADGSGLPPSADAARPEVKLSVPWDLLSADEYMPARPNSPMHCSMERAGVKLTMIISEPTKWEEVYEMVRLFGNLMRVRSRIPEASPASPAKPEQTPPGNSQVTGEERKIG